MFWIFIGFPFEECIRMNECGWMSAGIDTGDRYRALPDEVAIKYTPPLSFNKKILAP
jgi:hypothetical protein